MLFCNGVARAFYEPALFSVYAHSVPREAAPNASNWSNLSWQSACILGPMAGGFIYGYASHLFPGASGITAAFAGILLFLILSLIGVYMLPNVPGVLAREARARDSFFAGLLPVCAIDILHVGPEGLGLMRMAASLGAALTMIALVRFSPMNKPWRNILQLLTPEQMRGRVSAVNSMFIGSSAEIGDFESGMMANLLGTIPAVLFGGCMTLMIVIFVFAKTKKFLSLAICEIGPAGDQI